MQGRLRNRLNAGTLMVVVRDLTDEHTLKRFRLPAEQQVPMGLHPVAVQIEQSPIGTTEKNGLLAADGKRAEGEHKWFTKLGWQTDVRNLLQDRKLPRGQHYPNEIDSTTIPELVDQESIAEELRYHSLPLLESWSSDDLNITMHESDYHVGMSGAFVIDGTYEYKQLIQTVHDNLRVYNSRTSTLTVKTSTQLVSLIDAYTKLYEETFPPKPPKPENTNEADEKVEPNILLMHGCLPFSHQTYAPIQRTGRGIDMYFWRSSDDGYFSLQHQAAFIQLIRNLRIGWVGQVLYFLNRDNKTCQVRLHVSTPREKHLAYLEHRILDTKRLRNSLGDNEAVNEGETGRRNNEADMAWYRLKRSKHRLDKPIYYQKLKSLFQISGWSGFITNYFFPQIGHPKLSIDPSVPNKLPVVVYPLSHYNELTLGEFLIKTAHQAGLTPFLFFEHEDDYAFMRPSIVLRKKPALFVTSQCVDWRILEKAVRLFSETPLAIYKTYNTSSPRGFLLDKVLRALQDRYSDFQFFAHRRVLSQVIHLDLDANQTLCQLLDDITQSFGGVWDWIGGNKVFISACWAYGNVCNADGAVVPIE